MSNYCPERAKAEHLKMVEVGYQRFQKGGHRNVGTQRLDDMYRILGATESQKGQPGSNDMWRAAYDCPEASDAMVDRNLGAVFAEHIPQYRVMVDPKQGMDEFVRLAEQTHKLALALPKEDPWKEHFLGRRMPFTASGNQGDDERFRAVKGLAALHGDLLLHSSLYADSAR